jgi:hypothetical protein
MVDPRCATAKSDTVFYIRVYICIYMSSVASLQAAVLVDPRCATALYNIGTIKV